MHKMMSLLPALKATDGLVHDMSGPALLSTAKASGGLPGKAGLRPNRGAHQSRPIA